ASSGVSGSGPSIRIRGLGSMVLQGDPILIVDGVRQDNSAGGSTAAINGVGALDVRSVYPSPNRLNDLDVSDVETIEVLKGPSAPTEYGTDAANGVIVVTTKHGQVGRPRWRASAERTVSDLPVHFTDDYYAWGHTTDGTHTPVQCTLVPGP